MKTVFVAAADIYPKAWLILVSLWS